MVKKDLFKFMFIMVFYISFSIYIYSALLSPGIIMNRDLIRPYRLNQFIREYLPLWNENGYSNLHRISKLGIYSPIFFLFNIFNPFTVHVLFIYFICFSTISGLSMYLLTYFVLNIYFKDTSKIQIASFISSFIYFASPYIIEHVTHPAIRYAYSLAPLSILFLFKAFETADKKYNLYFGLLWSISCADVHWICFGLLLFMGSIIYDFVFKTIIDRPEKESVKNLFKESIINCYLSLSFFILFSFYWLLPNLLSGGASLYHHILTLEGLRNWFANASPFNLLAMKGNILLYKKYGEKPIILKGIYLDIFSYLIVILGFSSIFFANAREKIKKYKSYFYVLFTVSFILSTGPNVFRSFYNWFFFKAPFHSQYAWSFRTPKIHQFITLAISPLVGFTYMGISEKMRKYGKEINGLFNASFLSIIVISTILPNYPFMTTDMNGNLNPTTIPEEIKKIDDWLSDQEEDFKVLWAPHYASGRGQKPDWCSKPFTDITRVLSGKPSIGRNPYHFTTFGIEFNFESILSENATRNLGKFYSPLGVKYLIIHDDISNLKNKIDSLLEALKKQKDLNFIREEGFITIFEVNNYSKHIEVKDKTLSISGGLRKYNALTYANGFDPTKTAVIYMDSGVKDPHSDIFVLSNSEDVTISNVLSQAIILKPVDYTDHDKPSHFWSKDSLSSNYGPNYIQFWNTLHRYGLELPQFDYGEGIIYTWSQDSLSMPFNIKNEGKYYLFIRCFRNKRGGKMALYLDNEQIGIINTCNKIDNFIWKEIGCINLKRGKYNLTIQNMKGLNAINLLFLIPQKDYINVTEDLEDYLQSKQIIYIHEAETEMYNKNTIISKKYSINASNGEVLELNPTSKIWKKINILKSGQYTIAIRGKGNFNVKIDGKKHYLASPILNWIYSKPINLEKGMQKIEVESNYTYLKKWGFEGGLGGWIKKSPKIQNINLDSSTSYNGFYSLKDELYNISQSLEIIKSPMIPIIPGNKYKWNFYMAGENVHRICAKIYEYDINKRIIAKNLVAGPYHGNFTWKNIDFDYTPSQKASYIDLQIYHGHETKQLQPDRIWIDNVKVYGYHPSDLDVVWLYSTQKGDETLEDFFASKATPAEVKSYQKLGSTKYVVEVDAAEPFMLSFAEAYNPSWVARVNGEKIESIPLYSVINGFWIDQTGELTVRIEYNPQRFFNYGSAISITGLMGSLAYFLWGWKKKNYETPMRCPYCRESYKKFREREIKFCPHCGKQLAHARVHRIRKYFRTQLAALGARARAD